MAIVQISKIQQRRGLQQDLPQLDSGEIGWSIDTRKIYIGNGTLDEGAPVEGQTELLTEFSIIDFTSGFSGNVLQLQSDVSVLQEDVLALQNGITDSTAFSLPAATNAMIAPITANNAIISYTLNQGANKQRTGTIRMSHYLGSTSVSYDDEYSETQTTDIVFGFNANTTQANLTYTSGTLTTLEYRIVQI